VTRSAGNKRTNYFTALVGGVAAGIVDNVWLRTSWAMLFAVIGRQSALYIIYTVGLVVAGIFIAGVVAAFKKKINWRLVGGVFVDLDSGQWAVQTLSEAAFGQMELLAC